MSKKTIGLPFSPDEARMGVRIGKTYELLVPGWEIGIDEARIGDPVTVTAIRGDSIIGTIPGVVAECGDWEFGREWLGPKKAAGKVMSNKNKKTRGAVVGPTLDALFQERDALKAENAELVKALTHVTDLLNDPGVGDLEQWKRGVREWTSRARALAKAGVKP